jgi:predicted MFS family arabinose efflux permease
MLPIAFLGAVLCWFGVPSTNNVLTGSTSFVDSLLSLLKNKSVIACLLGGLLAKATWQGVLSYGISFYRDQFGLSRSYASIVLSGLALIFMVGVLGSGRFINNFGRKSVTFVSFLLLGIFSLFYMGLGLFWVSMAVFMIMGLVSGFRRNAGQSLSMEQIPLLRGSMMSLSAAGDSLGSALGAGVGGYVLGKGGYWLMSFVLGVLGVISALIIHFSAIDPTNF